MHGESGGLKASRVYRVQRSSVAGCLAFFREFVCICACILCQYMSTIHIYIYIYIYIFIYTYTFIFIFMCIYIYTPELVAIAGFRA